MCARFVCNYVNWGHHWSQHKKTGPVPMIFKFFEFLFEYITFFHLHLLVFLTDSWNHILDHFWLILHVNIASNMFIILLKGSFFLRRQTSNSAVCSKQSSWFCHCCWNGCQVSDNVFFLGWFWTIYKWYWDVCADYPVTDCGSA